MTKSVLIKRTTLSTAMAAVLAASIGASVPSRAIAQPVQSGRPSNDVTLSVGTGQMVRLDGAMTDLFVANDAIADVQVRSTNQIYIFGKAPGETTVYATNKAGKVLYSANIRVGSNIGSVAQMLRLAMPEAQIVASPMNGMMLLTGTVAAPSDVEEATRLVQAFVGKEVQVVSRLKTATPLQVNLHVKIAEVSRTLSRDIGMNLLSRDTTGGFLFGLSRGRNVGTITNAPLSAFPNLDASSLYGLPAGSISLPFNPATGQFITSAGAGSTQFNPINPASLGTTLNFAGKLFGLDILSALDLAENDGRVVTLAEPNLTALSGETASFLAGGEFPIPTAQGINGTSVEFKEYGVSLAFTPTVLEGGRISMRVRPEVSELTQAGAIRLNGFEILGLKTRRAETTVELGSGQSFMIGGLLSNNSGNTVDKAPFLGDLPIIGSLFRSSSFRRGETELVIVVTPYLVKPVSAGEIALPTDGYRVPNEAKRVLLDQSEDSRSGERRPRPTMVQPQPSSPAVGAVGSASLPYVPAPAPAPVETQKAQLATQRPARTASAAPGFSF